MIRTVLTDIEGTTSSITFVQDVLFPYAAAHLPRFVRAHAGDPAVRPHLEAVRAESGAADDEAALAVLLEWIRTDRKATPLKALQGLIWEDGYRHGAFRAHVYPEVAGCLTAWRAAGLDLAVYSSGSVLAQRLFFGHSEAGDLTPLFSRWFDTTVGGKRDPASYRAIAHHLQGPGGDPGTILFLSDALAEVDAARDAGLATHLLCRTGAPGGTLARNGHLTATDFHAVAGHWGLIQPLRHAHHGTPP